MKTTLRQQLQAFDEGIYLDSNGNQDNHCYNFYDWFCKDKSLKAKSDRLFKQVKRFVKHSNIDQDKVYVFFKNNCPMNGPLYDDFRICDVESGDVIYTVTPKCGHSGKAEVWGRANNFKGPLVIGDTMNEIYSLGLQSYKLYI